MVSSNDSPVGLLDLKEGDVTVPLRIRPAADASMTSFATPAGLRCGDVAWSIGVVEGAEAVDGTKSPGACI